MHAPTGGTLFSAANRRRVEHWTWLPDGDGPFPLVVLLHGVYDAGGYVWWQQGGAHETAAKLIASGDVPAFALLMAGDTGAEQGSGYCDWADRTALVETYLIDELLPWCDGNLPVAGAQRHVTGLSMGGYGALLLALRHPGVFSSASSTSGFFDPLRLFGFVEEAADRMWGDEARRRAHDVRALIEAPDRRAGLRIALDCGVDDDLIADNRSLHARLDELGIDHGYAEHDGGHEWEYWARHLGDHLRFHFGAGGPLTPETGP